MFEGNSVETGKKNPNEQIRELRDQLDLALEEIYKAADELVASGGLYEDAEAVKAAYEEINSPVAEIHGQMVELEASDKVTDKYNSDESSGYDWSNGAADSASIALARYREAMMVVGGSLAYNALREREAERRK